MNLLILHLSDIHFRDQADPILKRVEALAASFRPHLPHAACIVIIISGDIANSGISSEYKLASRFLSDLKARLKGEVKVPLYTLLAPGNHDCDFTGDQAARQLVVEAVLKHSGALPESYLNTATKVQKDFFAFRKSHENKDVVVFEDRLWKTHVVSVSGFKVAFDVLNASWMSTKHEQQGGLFFPFESYAKPQPNECELRVTVLHHPLNWYSQSNYRAFRSFLHRLSDIILTGHEHQGAGREIDDGDDGRCIYIEGEALQTSNAARSGFNIITVNTETREYQYETLHLTGGRYEAEAPTQWESYRPIAKRATSRLAFSEEFCRTLKGPGATLKHPSGRDLSLDDIYVYPDVDDRSAKVNDAEKAKAPRLNSIFLTKAQKLTADILIQGDDESGKTRLLYKLAVEYETQGFSPLLLRGIRIKSASAAAVASEIESAVVAQYGSSNKTAFQQSKRTEKIVLLDDFDLCQLNAERKSSLIAELRLHFGRLILTVGENFEVAELFGGADLVSLDGMRSVKILPLGHARRLELIKKWNRIGVNEAISENEFLKACDDAEKLIESTKLRYVASTNPIFVLSLLQATASGITTEMHNSSFAHYYYFLIVGALEKAKVGKQELGGVLAACTHLSWYVRREGVDQCISLSQFRDFVREYSAGWTETNADKLLQTLIDSSLMERDGETVSFTYPYSYYYFLGKYASISRESPDVEDYVQYCLKHLYARECANTLLFLAHHSGNSSVLDHVTKAIDSHFATKRPASLEQEDIASIRGLLAHAPTLRYSGVKPDEYRRQKAEHDDQHAPDNDGLRDAPTETDRDLFQEIVSLSKAIEITGTLLTHQFSNYDRPTKNAAIKSMFDGAMRAVKMFYSHFEDVDELLKSISARMHRKHEGMSAEQAETATRHAIAFLLRIVTTSFVMRAGMNLRAKDLDDNITKVIVDNPTCAYRLIKLATEMQNPSRLPRFEIDRLRKEEGTNPAVMGVLQLLILQRLYAYETDHDDKQWAMTVFELGGQRSVVEMKQQQARPQNRLN